MKALAIDSAAPCMTIAAVNDDLYSCRVLDIGMHQSERILPEIQAVLEDVKLNPADIKFGCLCKGPGTFTGLRLAFAAIKGIELSFKFPIYGFDSLDTYALPFQKLNRTVLSCIDAKKKRFYASVYRNGEKCAGPMDAEITELKQFIDAEEEVILTGPDAVYFADEYDSVNPEQKFLVIESRNIDTCWQLIKMGESALEQNLPPMGEFEGPVYIRPSEAEEAKHSK